MVDASNEEMETYNGTARILFIISAPISAISSIVIIDIIFRSQSKLSSPYHTIIAFMSFWDIVASLAMAATTLPMPSDVLDEDNTTQYMNMAHTNANFSALGNDTTCKIQGISAATGGLFTLCSNVILNVFYVCTIRYGMTETTAKRRLIPIAFVISSIFVLFTIVTSWNLTEPQLFPPMCSFFPLSEDLPSSGLSNSILPFFAFYVLTVSMVAVIVTVFCRTSVDVDVENEDTENMEDDEDHFNDHSTTTRTNINIATVSSPAHLTNPAFESAWGDDDNDNDNDDAGNDKPNLDQESGDGIILEENNHVTTNEDIHEHTHEEHTHAHDHAHEHAHEHTHEHTHEHAHEHAHEHDQATIHVHNERRTYRQSILLQALMYFTAFSLTWCWSFAVVILRTYQKSVPHYIQIITAIFLPLQGFLNALIFITNQVQLLRKRCPDITFGIALKTVIVSPSAVPEVFVSGLELVVRNTTTTNNDDHNGNDDNNNNNNVGVSIPAVGDSDCDSDGDSDVVMVANSTEAFFSLSSDTSMSATSPAAIL